jgi:hypothetical protein
MADKSDMYESLMLLMGTQEALSMLQKRMAALETPNQGVQAAMQQVRDEYEQTHSEMKIEYETKLATLSSQNEWLQKEKAIWIAEADQAQAQLGTEDSEVYKKFTMKFAVATETYKKEICELQEELTRSMSLISNLQAQKVRQGEEINQLKSKCAALSGEVDFPCIAARVVGVGTPSSYGVPPIEQYKTEQSSTPVKQSRPQSAPNTPAKTHTDSATDSASGKFVRRDKCNTSKPIVGVQ